MLNNQLATRLDDTLILDIWERSVIATHLFLQSEDIAFYKEKIPDFFDLVELRIWFHNNQPIGFSGTTDQTLEILFLDPKHIGNGFGHEILIWLITQKNITKVDVNEQNEAAKAFYLNHGFKVMTKSAQDGFDKPYPILHLEK